MGPGEAQIIGGPEPDVPHEPGLGRFLLDEALWIGLAVALTVAAAGALQGRGGAFAAAAPGVALYGLHGLVGLHVVRKEFCKLHDWFRVNARAILWGLGGGALLVAFNALYGLVLDRLGIVPPDVADLLRELLPPWALLAWAVVMAPIVEEMYFRGRLLDAFTPRLGTAWAATLTSLAFAAIHGIPVFFPAFVVFAFVLFALRHRTGGLIAPILAHMINNAFALLGSRQ